MKTVHYYENQQHILSQLVNRVPVCDQDIRIKGRNGKIKDILEITENVYRVQVQFEPAAKKRTVTVDNKKKRR
ncbi:hypothetical protein ABET14_03005 [Heyndrickxia coagulans]|uniref:hypothetical protein n=1 Tax=Heyndrickxia coagulans TaxID=1398 RepID=UPI00105E3E22|nr:hypothetical protein [Heyndrickxia coagulans]MBF8416942.1 hypothetical protein [Heyndrickxia coagulans]MED4311607.1 hypothetical protein [Heyndrickxia coagulans]MED4406170.1 hypothetical protein [Heyndrickxia coagulans]